MCTLNVNLYKQLTKKKQLIKTIFNLKQYIWKARFTDFQKRLMLPFIFFF